MQINWLSLSLASLHTGYAMWEMMLHLMLCLHCVLFTTDNFLTNALRRCHLCCLEYIGLIY